MTTDWMIYREDYMKHPYHPDVGSLQGRVWSAAENSAEGCADTGDETPGETIMLGAVMLVSALCILGCLWAVFG